MRAARRIRDLCATGATALRCLSLALLVLPFANAAAAACKAESEMRRLEIPERVEGAIRIATFNIRIFSNASRDDCELAYIAAIVRNFDLLAIQELRDTKVLDRLRKALDKDKVVKVPKDTWKAEVSDPVGRGVKERYAFLYRADMVELVAKGKLVADKKDRFIREPYFASFRVGADEFTLLNIHLLFGTPQGRALELMALAEEFAKLKRKQPAGRRLMLLGDFNEPPESKSFSAALETVKRLKCRVTEGPGVRTTIGDISLYDNICYLDAGNAAKDPMRRHAIEKYDFAVFGVDKCLPEADAIEDARKRKAARAKCLGKASLPVSDHRPVWFELPFQPSED